MADSDHITSGSAIIRIDCPAKHLGSQGATQKGRADPVLPLWREFLVARACARKLTHRQQAIESVMMERIGFPVVQLPLAHGGHVSVADPDDLLEVLMADDPDGAERGAAVKRSLEAHQARWSAADAELGYSAALRAEARALARVRELAGRLWATPATSLTGVIAKLDALLDEGAPSSVASDFPWPQLRAIRKDLEKLDVAPPSSLRR